MDPPRPQLPPPPSGPSGRELLVAFRWPLVILGIAVALLLFAYFTYRATLRQAERAAVGLGDAARGLKEGIEDVAKGFLTGDVTETFVAAIPEIHSTGGGNLEVAIARATETFRRSESRRALWDTVDLGTTVSEVRVPVTYRYHLRLDDPWRVEIRDHLCIVRAPPLRPSLPPAIDTSRMETRVEASWLHLDADDQLTALERSITPRLAARAANPRHLDWVREPSRATVARFVRTWLLREEQWGGEGVRAIQVLFPGEEPDAAAPVTLSVERDPAPEG